MLDVITSKGVFLKLSAQIQRKFLVDVLLLLEHPQNVGRLSTTTHLASFCNSLLDLQRANGKNSRALVQGFKGSRYVIL